MTSLYYSQNGKQVESFGIQAEWMMNVKYSLIQKSHLAINNICLFHPPDVVPTYRPGRFGWRRGPMTRILNTPMVASDETK
jgi:hypothetical protein